MSLEWQEKILKMVEENFSTPNEPKVVPLEVELPESFELESVDLRHISILDRDELKIFNELRSLEELKSMYPDIPNHANLVDAVIKNMREHLVKPERLAAERKSMMSPEERQKELEEFIEKNRNDKRFLPLERSNMGLQFKLLSVYDEVNVWLIRCAYEDEGQMIKEYGCQCKAILCDKKPDATLLHIAIEHVGKPTSLKILFQSVIKLSEKSGKGQEYCCIACKATETDQREFFAHFWTDKCCNVNYLKDGSIDLEGIQKQRLSVLIDFVSKNDFKSLWE